MISAIILVETVGIVVFEPVITTTTQSSPVPRAD